MKRQDVIQLIPFGIAILLVVISIIQVLMIPNIINDKGEAVRYVISDSILYASFGLIIVLILIILRKKYWKHAFCALLIIALTPQIQFYNQALYFGFGRIRFELTALALLIFHIALTKEDLRYIFGYFKINEPEKEEIQERKIEKFERKFSTKNKNELEKIVDDNFLIPEAVEAARRLLKRK